MIQGSIETLFNAINNSEEYREYQEITSILNNNKEVKDLIEEIKVLQKKATRLEQENNEEYEVIDEEIKEKSNILNNIDDYKLYLSRLKNFNNVLLTSSSLIEDYIDEKVSI